MKKSNPGSANGILLIENIKNGKLINASEIQFLRADDNYTVIYLVEEKKLLVSKSLKSLENELNPSLFFRCHKSCVVNISHIKEYKTGRKENKIILKNNTELNIARRRVSRLKEFIHKNKGI